MSRGPWVRWAGYVGVAALFAVACGFLSSWQFERGETRAAANAVIEHNYDAAPRPLADLLPAGSAFADDAEWTPVVFTGTYHADDQLLVRNRPLGGTNAFEVLVPLELDDGRMIVVDRGWVPPGDGDGPAAIPAPPDGDVTVTARLRRSELPPRSGRGAPDGQVPTIHLPAIAAELDLPQLVPDAYAVMTTEEPSPDAVPNALPTPEVDPGPHLSYAIQWILFAVLGFVFIGSIIRTELRARREDAHDDSGERPRPTRTPRRDTDADAEDAILDAVR